MVDTGTLASRLGEVSEVTSAAELLAEFVVERLPGGGVRVYLLGPGDLCVTCNQAPVCPTRDRCLHLAAGIGAFARPPGHVERVPMAASGWEEVVRSERTCRLEDVPAALAAPSDNPTGTAFAVPLVAAGGLLGILGLRTPTPPSDEDLEAIETAARLSSFALRLLASLAIEAERRRQLLLVSDLGRKVNAILNDDLLLRQAATDIHSTLGFHNVMIFLRDPSEDRWVMRAQASRRARLSTAVEPIELDQGVIGRAARTGRTVLVQDVSQDPDFMNWFSDTRAEIAIPLQIGGSVDGILNVESDRVGGFGESDRLALETVANQLAIAIENARLFAMVRQREERYKVLVENNPGAVLHLDETGRIVFVNPATAELTGYPKSEVAQRFPSLLDLTFPEDRPLVERALSEALDGETQRDVTFRVRHADGDAREVTVSLQPLLGEDAPARGVVVLARDQTVENRLERRLRQSEKLSAIGSLVSGVAHELNNPLAGILGFAQLLLGRPTEEWSRQDVEKIEKNAKRCQEIVENLLAFARQAKLKKRPASINEVIDSVIRLNEYQFRMDDIEIQRDFDLRVPSVALDVHKWQQVFVNLASNAHQAMRETNAERRVIRFETRLRPGRIVIRISDTGPGIDAGARQRVFEPFYTTKPSGTGLGLGICFGIVTEHGGTIDLDPSYTDGACFRITLPADVGGGAEEAAPRARPTDRKGEGRSVLVVDDEVHVCEVVEGVLARHGYEIDVVHEGAAAIERLADRTYDVVLTDISMPGGLSGIDLYDRIHAEQPDLARRMIFITGDVLNEELMHRIQTLGVRHIEKPFDIHHLARLVGEVATPANGRGDQAEAPQG